MNVMDSSVSSEVARQYVTKGWAVTPVQQHGKTPTLNDWPNRRISEEELPGLFPPGTNIGVVLGEPSGGLVDIDLDCEIARHVAAMLLPETATFGRQSSPRSHWLYRVQAGIDTKKFQAKELGTIVEIRSTGGQTVFPGSVHPSGEAIEWDEEREVLEIDEHSLRECVTDIAVASVLFANWPAKGARHDASLALAGGLARSGVELDRAQRIMQAVGKATGCRDLDAKLQNIEGTYKKVKNGDEEVTGWPRLAEFIGEQAVKNIRKWLGDDSSCVVGVDVGAHGGSDLNQTAKLCTDVGNAARFVLLRGEEVRWCGPQGKWYVWTGKHWAVDDREAVLNAAKGVALSILDEAKAEESVGRWQQVLSAHAAKSQSRERLKAMVELAKPELSVVPGEFDDDPSLFNCANGTLDLRTGQLHPHDPANLITKIAGIEFDEQAEAPRWQEFLKQIFDGNAELIGYVKRLIGMMLTGDISEQILPVFWGQGANGKSTLLDAVGYVLGDYADAAAPDLLMQRSHDEHPTELADLMGKRLVVSSESEKNRKLKIQLVKRLTGDEMIKARFMRQDFFTFRRQFKLILVTNNKPRVDEDSEAVWRRLRLIPFDVVIPEKERDPKLLEKLKQEAPGILRWLVEGCLAWLREGLGEPAIVKNVTGEYRKESNPIEQFFEECCEFEDGAWTPSRELLNAYRIWSAEMGEEPVSDRDLYEALRRRGCKDGRKHRTRGWRGIGLAEGADEGGVSDIAGRIITMARGSA